MPQPKYILISISDVIIQIAEKTETKNYTEGILESILPDDEELETWTDKQIKDWEASNNKRMKAICKFLNDNNL